MTKIITVTNQKGGVGKTTTASALVSGLNQRGARVLGIDLDPQGNLGFTLGLDIGQVNTVYDVLIDAAKKHSIHLESTGADGLKYMSGINYIYELDFGDLSGWVYYVNGERLSVGCDAYELKAGDIIEWHYSLELGNDID